MLTGTKLSDFIERQTATLKGAVSRRNFLATGAALGALAGCSRADEPGQQGRPAARDSARVGDEDRINSNSRLDSAVLRPEHRPPTTAVPPGATAAAYRRYDPSLPPVSTERTIDVHWRAQEVPVRINANTVIAAWTFEGDVPGPILHVRQGDLVRFTLTNEGSMPHSMDFHAAQINPKEAFRSVAKGQSVSFEFRPRFAGAYVYHCGTAPVLMHIGSGMYGAIIVDPPEPLPAAREFVLVQSEFYLNSAAGGVSVCDYRKMATTLPDIVAFNGRPDQYIKEPIRVRRGERVRFYVVSAGPSHPCNFHVVGEQFDAVYLGSPPANPIRGAQTIAVPPGGGMVFDVVADVAGEFPFVNHGFGHGQKGAIGFLIVEE